MTISIRRDVKLFNRVSSLSPYEKTHEENAAFHLDLANIRQQLCEIRLQAAYLAYLSRVKY